MTLQVQLTAQGDDVKLSWTGQFRKCYCVNRDRVRQASQTVRDILQLVATEYQDDQASYAAYLQPLAYAGHLLKGALFYPTDNTDVDPLLKYLEGLPPATPLTIFSDSSVQVPWNFVFSGDAQTLPPATQKIQDFASFWTSRFKIRIRFINTELPPRGPINRASVKTLCALHRSRFRAAERVLEEHVDLAPKIERLLNHEVGTTADWNDCREKWKQIADSDSVLYIFAHSDGQKLYLKEEKDIHDINDRFRYELDTNGFHTTFKKRNAETNTICFINGCRTADGELGNGFLSVTSGPGFHGFIGSEAEISNKHATRYAVEFLSELIDNGRSVDQAFEQVRSVCFPMSLWYSCYAHPEFKLEGGLQ